MKTARYIKLRTFCKMPGDLALMRSHNPLKKSVVIEPTLELTTNFLANFKMPLNMKQTETPSVLMIHDPLLYLTRD